MTSLPDALRTLKDNLDRAASTSDTISLENLIQRAYQILIPSVQFLLSITNATDPLGQATLVNLNLIKNRCGELISKSSHEGIKSLSIRFLELYILTFSNCTSKSFFNLSNIPDDHPILNKSELTSESTKTLLQFLIPRLSSTDLSNFGASITYTINALSKIAVNCKDLQLYVAESFNTFFTSTLRHVAGSLNPRSLKNSLVHLVLVSIARIVSTDPNEAVQSKLIGAAAVYGYERAVIDHIKTVQSNRKILSRERESVEEPPLKVVRREEEVSEIEERIEREEVEMVSVPKETEVDWINDAFRRILSVGDVIHVEGQRAIDIRNSVLSIFAGLLRDQPCISDLIKLIAGDFELYRDVLLIWVSRLFTFDRNSVGPIIFDCFSELFSVNQTFPDHLKTCLNSFILNLPELPSNLIDFLKKVGASQNESHRNTALFCLFEILVNRTLDQSPTVDSLLELTQSNLIEVRKAASDLFIYEILTDSRTNHLHGHVLTTAIDRFASISDLQSDLVVDHVIKAKCHLLLTLSRSLPSLLSSIAELFSTFSPDVKSLILPLLKQLILEHSNSEEIIQILVANIADDFSAFVTAVISENLTEISEELIVSALTAWDNGGSVTIVIPFLSKMIESEIVDVLPRVIVELAQNSDLLRHVIKSVIEKSSVSASVLLLLIHDDVIDRDFDTEELRMSAITTCLDFVLKQKSLFSTNSLAAILNRILIKFKVPDCLVLTSMLALSTHPHLNNYLVSIFIPELIKLQVWHFSALWEGIPRLLLLLGNDCGPVLVKFPVAQINELIELAPILKEIGNNYLRKLNRWIGREVLNCFIHV
ncbi:hypothetical protein RCL1_003831 [Eukaryota sp. TZLM3-RCL]